MHEELYIPEGSKIKYYFLVLGCVLFPFSLFELSFKDSELFFTFRLDPPLLAASILFAVLYFIGVSGVMQRLYYPFLSALVLEFLRFGAISLFNLQTPFDRYIIYAYFMLASLGYSFILYFISLGKMRTKIYLLCWSITMLLIPPASCILRFHPFFAYEETVEGRFCFGLSYLIAFVVFNLAGVILFIFIKDDKAKEESRKKKAEKKSRKNQR